MAVRRDQVLEPLPEPVAVVVVMIMVVLFFVGSFVVVTVLVAVGVRVLAVVWHGRMIARMFDSPGIGTCAPGLGPVDYLHHGTA
jgi:hypothetical protein